MRGEGKFILRQSRWRLYYMKKLKDKREICREIGNGQSFKKNIGVKREEAGEESEQ